MSNDSQNIRSVYYSYASWKGEDGTRAARFKKHLRMIYLRLVRSSELWWTPTMKALRKYRNDTIVEVGCGQGRLLRMLDAAGFSSLVGVDHAPGYSLHLPPTCTFIASDVIKYLSDLPPHSVGAVVGIDFFEHFTRNELMDLLRMVSRVLKPGGAVIVRVPNASSSAGSTFAWGDLTHETMFTPTSLTQLFNHFSFETSVIRGHCPCASDWVAWVLTPFRIACGGLIRLGVRSMGVRNYFYEPNIFGVFLLLGHEGKGTVVGSK